LAEDATTALRLFDQKPFDLVITDMSYRIRTDSMSEHPQDEGGSGARDHDDRFWHDSKRGGSDAEGSL